MTTTPEAPHRSTAEAVDAVDRWSRGSDERDVPPRLRRWIARTLRVGVVLSAALLGVGLADLATSGTFTTEPARISEAVSPLTAGWASFTPTTWLLWGVFALLLTPFARVLLSAVVFGARRDSAFTAITLFVLLMLVVSFLVGVRV